LREAILVIAKLIKHWRFDPVTVFNKIGLTNDSSKEASVFIRWGVDRYFEKSGLSDLFKRYGDLEHNRDYKLFLSGHKKADLVNISKAASSAQTVVEFGCGVSTIAIAYLFQQRGNGRVYSIEADPKWAELVQQAINQLGLAEYCSIEQSTPRLVQDSLQVYSLFENLPNVRPDLIYLDGPSPLSVIGNQHGLTMQGLEFIVAADPMLYEWSLYVGAKIVVDGRINNVRFLQRNMKRKYKITRNYFRNVTTFELIR
jgi:hypothetical protein